MPELTAQFEVQHRGTVAPQTIMSRAIGIIVGRGGDVDFAPLGGTGTSARIEFRRGRFYLTDLDLSLLIQLNGRPLENYEPEALADGDVIRLNEIELHLNQNGSRLQIAVGTSVGAGDDLIHRSSSPDKTCTKTGESDRAADALREFWDKRSRDKIAQPSPLHPHEPPRPGKARFGWGPTRDLTRPWPVALLAWCAIVITVLCVAAAFIYARAFSPGPVSDPHTRRALLRTTAAIAARPNANSCTSCHALTSRMDQQCAACHQTTAFEATNTGIDAHAHGGIGCVACHTEHWGAGFAALNAAVATCAKCHRDGNTFNGQRMVTPHTGGVGYPVANGKWAWKGLTADEWAGKPDAASPALAAAVVRLPNETDDDWRRRQFHTLHLNRIRLGNSGLPGDARGLLSCSSCHRSLNPTDKITPASTCAKCHNGDNGMMDNQGKPVLAPAAPNCVSCHVQHAKQPDHWNAKLFSPQP